MSHFIKKCECGIVLGQCRCPSENKSVETVSPCEHKKAEEETIIEQDIPITIDFHNELDGLIGRLVPKGMNEQADFIYMMMEQGYGFEILPAISNGKLVGVSISTVTAKKTNLEPWNR